MPTSFTSARPKPFAYSSMAELYRQYCSLFLQGEPFKREVQSACGLRVALYDRHFLHLAGVTKDGAFRGNLNIQDERQIILATTSGFGSYSIDESRTPHLPAAWACIAEPDAAFRILTPQTATHAFFKHFGDGRYPVLQVMLKPDDKNRSTLMPITCFPTKVRQARSRYQQFELIWKRSA